MDIASLIVTEESGARAGVGKDIQTADPALAKEFTDNVDAFEEGVEVEPTEVIEPETAPSVDGTEEAEADGESQDPATISDAIDKDPDDDAALAVATPAADPLQRMIETWSGVSSELAGIFNTLKPITDAKKVADEAASNGPSIASDATLTIQPLKDGTPVQTETPGEAAFGPRQGTAKDVVDVQRTTGPSASENAINPRTSSLKEAQTRPDISADDAGTLAGADSPASTLADEPASAEKSRMKAIPRQAAAPLFAIQDRSLPLFAAPGDSVIPRTNEALSDLSRADPGHPHAPRTVPHNPVATIRQITDAVIRQRDDQIEIALAPEELGRVRMTLSGREHAMHVIIWAERPEVMDMLRRNAAMLIEQFTDIGVGDATLEFQERDDKSHDRGGWRQIVPDANDLPMGAVTQTTAVPAGAWISGLGRLDIRL